jgi:hypothetical protein
MTTTQTEAAPRKQSLYDIVQQVVSLLEEIDVADGEITPEVGARLDALFASREEKIDAYAAVCRLFIEEAEACKRYATSYTDRAAQKLERVKRLKLRLFDAMQQMQTTRIAGKTATAAIQVNGQASLELTTEEPPADAPAEYVKVKREWDREAIRAALTEGKELSFATLKRGEHLRFR